MKENHRSPISKISKILEKTYNDNVISTLDNFSSLYKMSVCGYKEPVLVSGVDGVGTKLRLAIDYKKYGIIGEDCFAMCVNDVLCHGAQPLFFLDYLACGKLDDKVVEKILQGIAISCKRNNTCFIGGETAEMPGIYKIKDYDVAGFCVGIVEKKNIIDGKKNLQEGDVLIGIPSSGVHSNGFSLIRKIFYTEDLLMQQFQKKPFYETLLIPTRIYHLTIHLLLKDFLIHGLVHVTGGGIYENLFRVIPENLEAIVEKKKIPIPPVFNHIQEKGLLSDQEMWNTFNMGVGMILIVSVKDKCPILQKLRLLGEKPFVFGHMIKGNKKVFLK
ncbi:MAG: phosphoribosylformylglycinamidine cyclo-ligase [Flavobacteriales bacterium]|jgi:phosphoribosylformylglycinamidine cyclo-ligase|uniref:phosphoribosylformylglycinamidine cyclo-ligase n=1 Tax=Blattabacterium sp. (Mastotermes darwiniensis) TaxID=39768 RepID=UPI000231DDD5|nr:phosphoribosylformylglycinamidine cyclo-ligase [Blattabacterium sp. (Mastotermes darwiniensis)]AER40521.1 phosphoribosylaminoimidazole synthetase [Blattabacterium sp. (Mastotermes darwiniensis) str. MADAR]MDR1804964.1 phosphoribosylformylglycinamidine cyclo-ligase [Flavobacteriales bacterium]